MLEFKLNYYFEKYKDTCVIFLPKFREKFIKENGDFSLINEVFIMIQKYQYKKYGDLVASGRKTGKEVKKGYYYKQEYNRLQKRLGTVAERKRRKIVEAYNDGK